MTIPKSINRLLHTFLIVAIVFTGVSALFSLLLQPQLARADGPDYNPPVAADDVYTTAEDTALTVVAPGVLSNDSDPDGDTLTATLLTAPANGSVALNENGSFVYTPTANFNGSDSFVYASADGPVLPAAYWPYNEGSGTSSADLSGNDQTAELVGETVFTSTLPGTPTFTNTYALSFDGSGDWATVASTEHINLDTFSQRTVMAWFKADDVNINSRKQIIWEEGGGTNGLNIYLYDGLLYGGAWSNNTGWSDGYWISSTNIISGQWHHAALVLDSDSAWGPEPDALHLYLDGWLVGSGEAAPLGNHFGGIGIGDMVFDTNFHNGDGQGDGGFGFAGLIDELHVYNDVLTQAEIQALMTTDRPNLGDTATVTITVTAVNDAPSAAADSYHTLNGEILTVAAPGVLNNDTDIDGDVISATLISDVTNGTLDLALDGSFVYTPAISSGVDTFTYVTTDGLLQSNTTTVTLEVWPWPGRLVADPTGLNAAVGLGYSSTLSLALSNEGESATAFTLVETADSPLASSPSITTPLFQLDAGTPTGHFYLLGLEYAFGSYWVTSGGATSTPDDNYLFELDEDGTVLHSWEQGTTSTWGWHDLAFDGTYLYGSDSNVVSQIDPETGQVTGVTIPCPTDPCRALAYDPATDHFWSANQKSDIWEFDRSGTIINQYSNSLTIYGAAWDVYSDGGPYLWVWSTDGFPPVTATQLDPETGLSTGLSFSGDNSVISYARGADIVDDHPDYPGQLLFVGMQWLSNMIGGYDLGTFSEDVAWVSEGPATGTVPVSGTQTVDVTFNAASPAITQTGVYTAGLMVVNDGDTGALTIPLTLTVFNGVPLNLNTAGDGSGVVTANPDQPVYQSGEIVVLTATPNTGSTFDGWSGDLTGTTNPVTITMTATKVITATFSREQGDIFLPLILKN